MNVVDQVEKTLEAEKTATESSYRKIVKRLALNEDVSKDEVAATLKASGKTLPTLRADVDREKRANECRKIINDNPAVLKRLRKAEAAKVDFHQRQQKSFRDFRDEWPKVGTELNLAQTAFNSIGKAAAELEELTGEVVELPVAEPEPTEATQAPTTGRKSKRS